MAVWGVGPFSSQRRNNAVVLSMKVITSVRGWLRLAFVASLMARLAAESLPPACISEFQANNQHGLKDEAGENTGWIEIYNPGVTPLNLGGWFLTDTVTNLTRWKFPTVWLLPEKYLLVFTSGKGRGAVPGHLHASVELRPEGGYLALVDRSTNVVSEFADYPEQPPDTSYGRAAGELSMVGRFVRPTPGKPNMIQGPGFAPEVIFSRPGGSVTSPFTIELRCDSPRAVIHYTTDGTLPNAWSPPYRAPIKVAKTVHLRARAFAEGLLPGPPRSETYLFLQPGVRSFTSNLPVLVMDLMGQDAANSSADTVAHLSFFEPVGGRTSLTNPPCLATRAACRARGSSTMNLPQSSFVLHLLDEFNQEQHQSVLGLPADSDWVLYAPNRFEPVMIHNPFVHQLSREMGRYSPRTRFLEVYVVQRAGQVGERQYEGIYILEEKIKVGKHRVDIDRLSSADVRPPEVTGGYLLKMDRLGPNESGLWAGNAALVYVEPKERVISLSDRAPQREYLTSYFEAFARALQGPQWKDPVVGYRAYIDVDSWIDYHVLEVLSGNVDALIYSTYFYKPRNGKLVFGPHWDFDRALGSTDGRDENPRRWNTGRFFVGTWWSQILRDPDFWQLWVDRWQELRQKQFSLEHLNELIDQLTAELREAQPREAERWDLQPRGGSYQSEIDWMKEWLSNRVDFIDSQLTPKPALEMPIERRGDGQLVSLTVPANASVYYTLDGSDPRLSQGGISSNAMIYVEPIRLQAEARLFARTRDPAKHQRGGPRSSTPWSGPLQAILKVTPSTPGRE